METERIKFYADTPQGEKNKYFCFNIKSVLEYEACIKRFYTKGFNFRAIWYEKLDEGGKSILNIRQKDLQMYLDGLID